MNINQLEYCIIILFNPLHRFKWEYDHSDTVCIIDDFIVGGCSSHMTIQWFIPPGATPGTYRIQHFGAYKNNGVHQYQGVSGTFKVTEM